MEYNFCTNDIVDSFSTSEFLLNVRYTLLLTIFFVISWFRRYSSRPGLSTGSGPQINFRPEGDAVTDEDREQNGVNTSNSISINEDEASRPDLSTGSGPQINFLPQGDAVTDEDQEQNGVNT